MREVDGRLEVLRRIERSGAEEQRELDDQVDDPAEGRDGQVDAEAAARARSLLRPVVRRLDLRDVRAGAVPVLRGPLRLLNVVLLTS